VSDAASQTTVAVRVVHAAVAGRIRMHGAGIRRAPNVAAAVEHLLLTHPSVRSATASPLTGNILVHYESEITSDALADFLEKCIRDVQTSRGAPREARHDVPVARDRRKSPGGAIGQHLRRFGRTRNADGRSSSFPGTSTELPALENPGGPDEDTAWHCLTTDHVLETLGTSASGLTSEDAQNRLRRFGQNRLTAARRRSLTRIIAEQFESVPVALLAGSAVVSIATGGIGDAVVILGVVAANAAIGAYAEHRAERTVTALTRFELAPVLTRRDAEERRTPAPHLVPGDVITLARGDVVPADARLLDAHDLSIDESALTGESVPVSKSTDALEDRRLALADRRNMVFRGTTVTGGSGLAVVVATGPRTEVGRVQTLVGEASQPETPLQRQLRVLGRQLMIATGLVAGGVVVIGVLRGYRMIEILKTAISLAVAAVPEGLPTVSTTTLAAGVRRLHARGLLVRRLDSIETLGAIQVIGLDKTGTITANQMAVATVWVSGRRYVAHASNGLRTDDGAASDALVSEVDWVLRIGVLCSDAEVRRQGDDWVVEGTPTEAALIHLAIDARRDPIEARVAHPILAKQARAEGRMYMATLHRGSAGRLLTVKGRPDQLLARCTRIAIDGRQRTFDAEDRMSIESENERMAGAGLRVLGLAMAEGDDIDLDPAVPLTWIGLVGISDPPRPEIRELIAGFYRAGVKPVMITGDQSSTACSIARDIGLAPGRELHVLDSMALTGLPPNLLAALAPRVDVFSRVSPGQKLNVIKALQHAGVVVAMTGDGINDGPALRAADVGIALGKRGADVARETADIVLADDQLDSLLAALAEGRTIADDLQKAVHFVVATNLSEVLVTLSAVALGLAAPLTPRQLLWINLLTDVLPELALAVDPAQTDVLLRPPRASSAQLVSRAQYARIGGDATIMTLAALASYVVGLKRGGGVSSTMAFVTLTAAQLLHAIGARSSALSLLAGRHLPHNQYMAPAVGVGVAIQLAAGVAAPVRQLMGAAPLSVGDAAFAWGMAGASFLGTEAVKLARQGRDHHEA
jgi:Ca2+-transporting ATPase